MNPDGKDYTLVVYKFDKRYSSGETKVGSYDYSNKTLEWMKDEISELENTVMPAHKYRIELHETYIEKTNAMTGEKFMERFDTPYSCSPSSEAYWSN